MSVTKERFKERLDFFATLWIIISTGSLFFCIFNMKLTMFILLGIAGVYVFEYRKLNRKQLHTLAAILIVVVINALINIRYLNLTDDIIILLIRLFSIAIICSYVNKERFMTNFCRILFALCILSLICFAISELGVTLPGQRTIWFKNKYYIYTIYHTVGRWTIFHRNAGIFWESPAFAIFINIALAFLMLGDVEIAAKKRTLYFIVYSATLFSTLAITGYIEFALILIAIILQRRRDNKTQESKSSKYLIGIAVIVVAIIFLVRENNTHLIANKILYRQGSYAERSNDTLQAIYLAMDRPFTGYGLFNNYTSSALSAVKVTDNSNSFTAMLMNLGIPFFAIYIFAFIKGIKQYFDCSMLSFVFICGAFMLFLNSEQIALMTLFLFFLFPLRVRKAESLPEQVNNQNGQ